MKNAIQLVPALENNNYLFLKTGIQLDYTRENNLTEINKMGFNQFSITTIGTNNFRVVPDLYGTIYLVAINITC